MAKRTEDEIMADLLDVFCGLSPENLSADGMNSDTTIRKISARLFKELAVLEKELGRKVDESEVYRYALKSMNI